MRDAAIAPNSRVKQHLRGARYLVGVLCDAGLPSAHSGGNWTAGQARGSHYRAGRAPLVGAGPRGLRMASGEVR